MLENQHKDEKSIGANSNERTRLPFHKPPLPWSFAWPQMFVSWFSYPLPVPQSLISWYAHASHTPTTMRTLPLPFHSTPSHRIASHPRTGLGFEPNLQGISIFQFSALVGMMTLPPIYLLCTTSLLYLLQAQYQVSTSSTTDLISRSCR